MARPAAAVLAAAHGGERLWWPVLEPAAPTAAYPFLVGDRLGRVDRLLAELDRREGRA